MSKWFNDCLPRIGDIKESVNQISDAIQSIDSVRHVYVFGSYAKNLNNNKFRVKDIDIIAQVSFHSEDLIAINNEILNNKLEFLEEEGFDVESVKFSKEYIKIGGKDIDRWAMSLDKKLLHWGPIIVSKEEQDNIKKEAEMYAYKETGFNLNKLHKSSSQKRKQWFETFADYMQCQVSDMPSGWYCSNENVEHVLSKAIILK